MDGRPSATPRRAPDAPYREGTPVRKPVVLIAEELSPATVEALGPDFEVRTCDGADRGWRAPDVFAVSPAPGARRLR